MKLIFLIINLDVNIRNLDTNIRIFFSVIQILNFQLLQMLGILLYSMLYKSVVCCS